jgi:hypothetical protein
MSKSWKMQKKVHLELTFLFLILINGSIRIGFWKVIEIKVILNQLLFHVLLDRIYGKKK